MHGQRTSTFVAAWCLRVSPVVWLEEGQAHGGPGQAMTALQVHALEAGQLQRLTQTPPRNRAVHAPMKMMSTASKGEGDYTRIRCRWSGAHREATFFMYQGHMQQALHNTYYCHVC